jgi:hypothetical protein
MLACGIIAFLLSDLDYYNDPTKYPATQLSSPLLPVAISAIVGYFVAAMFFSVRHDRVLVCDAIKPAPARARNRC